MKAKIESYGGTPTVMVDGNPYSAHALTLMCLEEKNKDYLRKLGKAGIKLHYLLTALAWGNEKVTEDLRMRFDTVFEAVPDAYVILRVRIDPPVNWVKEHPEEQIKYSDGEKRPTYGYENMYSLASRKWRELVDREIENYFAVVSKFPNFDRVIGVFIRSAGTDEWYYPCMMHDDVVTTDYSEPLRMEYSDHIREKYKTEDALRNAWHIPDASFENPHIPSQYERYHIDKAENAFINDMYSWEDSRYRTARESLDESKPMPNIGLFLNANAYQATADYYDSLHIGTVNTIIHVAKKIKSLYPDFLVGTFYGYFGCTDYYEASHTGGITKLLECDAVDIISAPGVYNNREPGGCVTQRVMFDSFALHNKVFFSEDDCRSHHVHTSMQRAGGAIYTLEDSINNLKRDFARTICDNTYSWWFDMENDWYDDPDIISLFKRQEEIAEYAYTQNREKHHDIAIVYDVQSIHYASQGLDKLVLDFYRASDLCRLGTSADFIFHDDLRLDSTPDYKTYIMLNQYYLSNEEREQIYAKARKNHATVVWMYAPGFVNQDGNTTMNPENISKTVGMTVTMKEGVDFPYFRIDSDIHPIVGYTDKYRRYGYIDRRVQSNVWMNATVLQPAFVNPLFGIEESDGITVLGRYCDGGAPAMAMRELDGFTSVYIATPTVRSEVISSIALWSGCHIYSLSDDIIYANEHFVTVHASYTGKRTVKFKKPCNPFEVFEKVFYGHNVSELTLDMHFGETKMFLLDGVC